MSSTVDPNQRYVDRLEGTGLSLFVVSIVGVALSAVVVGLRTFTRIRARNFGLDDILMLVGMVTSVANAILICLGAVHGLGALDKNLNVQMSVDATMYLMLWMLVYMGTLCIIKLSICITTLRIATTMPKLRISVYALMGLTVATFVTTFIGVLLLCRPVEANWDKSIVEEGRGECSPISAMLGLSYMTTATTIVTDLACAILPAVILWQTHIKLSTKIMLSVVLSFGSFASISTMIRTPYIDNYNRPEDNFSYHIANVPLWSNIETAVGLIAGSLPALRQLVVSRRRDATTAGDNTHGFHQGSGAVVTIGGSRALKSKNRKDLKSNFAAITEADQGDWTRLEEGDNSSDKESTVPINGIRKDVTFDLEMQSMRSGRRGPEHP